MKQRIVAADALDAVKVRGSERIMPPLTRPGEPAEPRSLRTPLIEALSDEPESVDPARVAAELVAALRDGRGHEFIPLCGQSAGLIDQVLPAAEILQRVITEAEAVSATYRDREQESRVAPVRATGAWRDSRPSRRPRDDLAD